MTMVQRRPSFWLFKKLILKLRSMQLKLRSQQLGSDFELFSEPPHTNPNLAKSLVRSQFTASTFLTVLIVGRAWLSQLGLLETSSLLLLR